jgi:hypothetical protein
MNNPATKSATDAIGQVDGVARNSVRITHGQHDFASFISTVCHFLTCLNFAI